MKTKLIALCALILIVGGAMAGCSDSSLYSGVSQDNSTPYSAPTTSYDFPTEDEQITFECEEELNYGD